MDYASLASGSKGNCHAIHHHGTVLLIDAGLSLRQVERRLNLIGWDIGWVQGIAITHEHNDHISALPVLLRNTAWIFLLTEQTKKAIESKTRIVIPDHRWVPLKSGSSLSFGSWTIQPFSLPHDAVDPVAFRVERGGQSLAIITDLGHISETVRQSCAGVETLVIESNYDEQMLIDGPYTPELKARILSRVGHLSNEDTAGLLSSMDTSRLNRVVLAHLSEENNHAELARSSAMLALQHAPRARIFIADQHHPVLSST